MQMNMKLGMLSLVVVASACAGTYPVPTQRLADAQSASRSAVELGADKNPDAQLYAKLSDEQIVKANAVMKDGDNRRADMMLVRAKADAELALALAKEAKAKNEVQKASELSKTQIQATQGAAQ
jgi:Domain of unknown function (DUF4398)